MTKFLEKLKVWWEGFTGAFWNRWFGPEFEKIEPIPEPEVIPEPAPVVQPTPVKTKKRARKKK